MKFAFSPSASPTWDFPTLVARAKEYGYDGIEIRASPILRRQSFLSDPASSNPFRNAGIEICCLASSISMSQDKKKTRRRRMTAAYIDTAQKLGCPIVKIFDTQVQPGSV
jgi:sugar phosphate isomerase/epimerase